MCIHTYIYIYVNNKYTYIYMYVCIYVYTYKCIHHGLCGKRNAIDYPIINQP